MVSSPLTYGQLFIGPATYIALFGWLYALIGGAVGLAAWKSSRWMRPASMIVAGAALAPLLAYALARATINAWAETSASMPIWNTLLVGLIALLPTAVTFAIVHAVLTKRAVRRA
jgi:hypothetical protein